MRGHDHLLVQADGAAKGVGQQALVVGDGGADGDAGALVDVRAAPGQAGDLGDDLLHVLGHAHLVLHVIEPVALLLHDVDLVLDAARVVSADLGAVAVLERRDDAAAIRVVLGVGAGHQVDVQRQADAVAPDLHVPLLHDVEEADLDALRQVRELVDAEDAAVGAWDQAVVDGELVRQVAALRHLDGVHLADEVGDGDVRSRQLLAVALVRREPGDLEAIALLGKTVAAALADGPERVVVDLAAGDDRHRVVQQVHQGADEPGLGLPSLAQEDDVLSGEEGVLQLGDHRLLIAHDAGEERPAPPDLLDEVAAHLLLHGDYLVVGVAQLL